MERAVPNLPVDDLAVAKDYALFVIGPIV